ncbi:MULTISPECIES: hypothetical protein [Haloferax]|uniref:Uncharacterized protein n=1 Tax=Haloferax marinum TaxID=2666143 RepID=A0A6A8G5J0_9EURY|nr:MULTISPECIES: hypothetical protein [Haloferax]KAB1197262.1 hypothetical protein Hfx1150_06930 [Haloferax sp. CBA1150]MRW96299.1 hypothetical protein [Haloferax marinum]
MIPDLLVGLGISGFFLFIGIAPWYHPTLFLPYFDSDDVDPWPQLSFTLAAYLGGAFFVLTVEVNLYFVQAIVSVTIGVAVLLRHDRNPRGDDSIWPSRGAAKASLGVGGVFAFFGVLATVGLI